jgi:hypothetical protein
VHEAAARVAAAPIGNVVGADFLYDEQAAGMLQSGVLLKEIDELIRGLHRERPDGELKARICALVFLISQIPSRTIGGETGLRATAPFLADLLVEDLNFDGAKLRKRVSELLDELVDAGAVQRLDDEYLLQTEEGAEWEREYRSRLATVRDDATRMVQLRAERLQRAVEAALGNVKLTQGTSKTPRALNLYWGQDEPTPVDGDVPVWIRDEWSVTEATVKKAAAEAGDESPIIFVLLPRLEADQIKEALASYAAAEQTLQRPTPQTDEGKSAQRAMRTRLDAEDDRLTTLFNDVSAHARVFQGGGNEVTTSSLRGAVDTAAERSLIRLFPKFAAGDNPNWAKVVTKARDGAPDALEAVGHRGEPTTNAVCKEVLAAISPGGTKGAELQKRFGAPPFGWPRDAVNGAILTLFAAGNVRAAQDHKDLTGPKELPPNQIGKANLYKEDEPPTVGQRLAVKGLLTAAEIPYEPGQEGAQVAALLQRLKDLAARAGGPPPLPDPPDFDHIDALSTLGGNQRFRAVADDHDRLRDDLARWTTASEQRERRESEWQQVQRLFRHADGLPVTATIDPAVVAIRDGRQLLDQPDPVAPLLQTLTSALRAAVKQRADQLADAQRAVVSDIERWSEWTKLDLSVRDALLADAKLGAGPFPDVSTDAALLEVLDATPLSAWQDRISLVPSRGDQLRERVLERLQPESVRVIIPPVTIKTEDELDAHLADVRSRVQPHLDAGNTVIL